MQLLKLKLLLLLFLIFFISAILLNSVGIVILQSVTHYKATEIEASILEACRGSNNSGSFILDLLIYPKVWL
ncbi:hypothetical protein DR85_1584 [Francisella tularensis]|nr:hypothetical protein DR85_1584 [Francisella tularensis]